MYLVLFYLFFRCFLVTFSAKELNYYAPSDYVAIDCSPSNPSFSESHFNSRFSTVSKVYALDPESQGKPKISACIFRSRFTYNFPVSVGPKYVRLFFIPATYPGLSLSHALFTVRAGSSTLLTTSESSYHQLHSDTAREFIINSQGQLLNVTFTPSPLVSGAYAFVNKIEIVSMPSMLYIQESKPLPLVSHASGSYSMQKSTALETMYRINIGGDFITPLEDNGMFRVWDSDMFYFTNSSDDEHSGRIKLEVEITTNSFAAPIQVYSTARTAFGASVSNYSLQWSFPVETGFYYFVRLHYCEISSRINQDDQRVFRVCYSHKPLIP